MSSSFFLIPQRKAFLVFSILTCVWRGHISYLVSILSVLLCNSFIRPLISTFGVCLTIRRDLNNPLSRCPVSDNFSLIWQHSDNTLILALRLFCRLSFKGSQLDQRNEWILLNSALYILLSWAGSSLLHLSWNSVLVTSFSFTPVYIPLDISFLFSSHFNYELIASKGQWWQVVIKIAIPEHFCFHFLNAS